MSAVRRLKLAKHFSGFYNVIDLIETKRPPYANGIKFSLLVL